jgi:hypothetical protein
MLDLGESSREERSVLSLLLFVFAVENQLASQCCYRIVPWDRTESSLSGKQRAASEPINQLDQQKRKMSRAF